MEPEQKSNGALVGLIIVVIILVFGGIYLWRNSAKERAKLEGVNPTSDNTPSTTDSTVNLEANINSIDLESLDSGI